MVNHEQGRSMIEMLGVIAIIGILTIGGMNGYQSAMLKSRQNRLVENLNNIVENTRDMYASQRDYRGLDNKIAALIGILPDDMYDKVENNQEDYLTVTNSFAGQFKIEAASLENNNYGAFVMAVDSIPSSVCLSLVTTDWSGANNTDILAVYVNSADGNSVNDNINFDTTESPSVHLSGVSSTQDTDSSTPFIDSSAVLASEDAMKACGVSKHVTIAWKIL